MVVWIVPSPLKLTVSHFSWIFIGRTDAEAETPILWLPDAKSQLIGKDPDAGIDWWWEEKGTTEDEMVGWHQQPYGREFEWGGFGDRPGSLTCCSPWVAENWTKLCDWNELIIILNINYFTIYVSNVHSNHTRLIHYLYYKHTVLCLVTQSCLTFCDPVDCSPPGCSVHGILQAIILEWSAISFSR